MYNSITIGVVNFLEEYVQNVFPVYCIINICIFQEI